MKAVRKEVNDQQTKRVKKMLIQPALEPLCRPELDLAWSRTCIPEHRQWIRRARVPGQDVRADQRRESANDDIECCYEAVSVLIVSIPHQ